MHVNLNKENLYLSECTGNTRLLLDTIKNDVKNKQNCNLSLITKFIQDSINNYSQSKKWG